MTVILEQWITPVDRAHMWECASHLKQTITWLITAYCVYSGYLNALSWDLQKCQIPTAATEINGSYAISILSNHIIISLKSKTLDIQIRHLQWVQIFYFQISVFSLCISTKMRLPVLPHSASMLWKCMYFLKSSYLSYEHHLEAHK